MPFCNSNSLRFISSKDFPAADHAQRKPPLVWQRFLALLDHAPDIT
jgi:hypothetical protein